MDTPPRNRPCPELIDEPWILTGPTAWSRPVAEEIFAAAGLSRPNHRMLRKLKTYLGRIIRDITRKLAGKPWLEPVFERLLNLARRVHAQERGQRGPKIYSLHAPEVECIGKGKEQDSYGFDDCVV